MAHVLIIDDDHDVTRLLEMHLTEEGHHVTVTHDGKEGMSQVLKNTPHLIMLDVFLPDATGYQMCNRIRKNEATKETPIIMMTGAARFPNQQMYGRQRGANEYIFKPFDIVQVGELVSKYIKPTPAAPAPTPAATPAPIQAAVENFIPTPVPKPLAQPPVKTPQDPLLTISTFFQRNTDPVKAAETQGDDMDFTPRIENPVEPLSPIHRIAREPRPIELTVNGNDHAPVVPTFQTSVPTPEQQPAPMPVPLSIPTPAPMIVASAIPPAREGYVAISFGGRERVIELGLEIYAIATRLCSSHTETYLADQLLRTSLGVGAKLNAAQCSASPEEFAQTAGAALRELRETAYWLMIARKAGVLEKLARPDLEKTCQSLITLLTDYAAAKKA